jgi:uncharacterized membrane protein
MGDLRERIISSARNAASAAESAASAVRSTDVNVGDTERILSLASGAMLLGYGMYRRGTRGYASMLVGAALCDRGVRGHCAVNAAIGRNTADADGIRIRGDNGEENEGRGLVEYSVTIDRPIHEIYRKLCQKAELDRVLGISMPSESKPNGAGNGSASGSMEITGREENHRIDWKTGEGLSGSILLADAPGNRGTEITVFLGSESPRDVLGRAIAWLSRVGAGARLHKGLRQMKQELEAGEIPTTEGQASGRTSSQRGEREPMVLSEL